MPALRTWLGILLCVALPAIAQDALPRPDVKPGDRWTYRRVDLWNNNETTRYEMEVSFVGNGVIQAVNRRRQEEIDVAYTTDWNFMSDLDGGVTTPHSGLLKFPLKAGDTYSTRYETTRPRLGAFRAVNELEVSVGGYEEVTVPAGKFRALRVEASGGYRRLDVSGSGKLKIVYWYAPEVRRWVKATVENTDFRGQPFNRFAEELVEANLK